MSIARFRRAVVLATVLAGCEYDLDVGRSWQITHPRVIAVGVEVVEPSAIWPERLAAHDEAAPIAEALPGDRVRLVPLVVDGGGRRMAPETIDTIWFQCGFEDDCVVEVPRCDALDWTTDSVCEIGRGRDVHFDLPALGPDGLAHRTMRVMGIVGREPSASAERCLAGLLDKSDELSDCTLIEAHVLIGPHWVLEFVAAEAGLEPELPLDRIHPLVLQQAANRVPTPGPPVWRDAETDEPLEGTPPRLRPGQEVTTDGPDWSISERQVYAGVSRIDASEAYLFEGYYEARGALYFGSGAIRFGEQDGSRLELYVDEDAVAGTVRIVVVVSDMRLHDSVSYYERYGAVGMFVQELEIVP